jgi:hypothetical protein
MRESLRQRDRPPIPKHAVRAGAAAQAVGGLTGKPAGGRRVAVCSSPRMQGRFAAQALPEITCRHGGLGQILQSIKRSRHSQHLHRTLSISLPRPSGILISS